MSERIGPPCPYCGAHCTQNDHWATGDYNRQWACGSWTDDNIGHVERSERCRRLESENIEEIDFRYRGNPRP